MATGLDITITGAPNLQAISAATAIVRRMDTRVQETGNVNYGDSIGTVPEIFTLQITAAATAAGSAVLTLDGVANNVPLTITTINANAAEINTYINASILGYSSTVAADTVTVTALTGGAQTNATYAAGTATTSAGTVVVTQDGVTGSTALINSTANDPYKLFFFDTLKEGTKYNLAFNKVAPNAEP
jgi:hypothetical protein